jgi:hypothetical protein
MGLKRYRWMYYTARIVHYLGEHMNILVLCAFSPGGEITTDLPILCDTSNAALSTMIVYMWSEDICIA